MNLGDGRVLGSVLLQVHAVTAQAEAERNIPRALAVVALVPQRVAPRSHWLTAAMIVITSLPAAELVSSASATEAC